MTTPNQPAPTWMELVGLGAFEIGGSGGGAGLPSFGQGVTSDAVTQVISGPATALMNIDGVAAQSDVLTLVSNYLSTLPLQALQMFQGFLPGKTAADFVDVPTAVTTIMGALGLGTLSGTSTALARLMTDLMVLFDVFHITCQAGTSGDAPGTLGTNGKPTWYSCWNDILSMVGLWTGTSAPTTPAPTIGTAITAAGTAGSNGSSWSTSLTNDLTVLLDVFHITYSSTQWNAAWADLLSLFGIVNSVTAPTNPTPTIGPAITSAQASATTATTNAATAQTTANTGVTNAATAQTKANTASTWATRLTNNLLVTSDVFHLTYAAGSSGDAPGTIWSGGGVGNGKVTWYSCWNDLLGLAGTVNAVTAPTDAAPTTGAVIAANTAAATTAGTNASMALSNAAAAATSASAAGTLAQSTIDTVINSQTGLLTTGQAVTGITGALTAIPASNVVGLIGAAVAWGATGAGAVDSSAANPKTKTETHTVAAPDLSVYAAVSWTASSSSTCTSSVTYGGTAMTLVKRQVSSTYSSKNLYLEVWVLKTPPTGTQTVSATVSSSGSSTVPNMAVGSVSYSASKVVASSGNSGSGSTSLSMTQPSGTNHMVIGVFLIDENGATVTLSSPTQTSRSALSTAGGLNMVICDAVGTSSVSFGITASAAPSAWCGITVDISN